MNRALIATLTAMCVASFISLPSPAEESATTADAAAATALDDASTQGDGKKLAQKDPKSDPKADPKADAGKSKSAKGGSKVDLGTRLASFVVCTVVGTPIALVRRTGIEIAQGNHDLVGDPDTWYRKIGVVMPGFLAVPYGAVSGGIGGPLYAVKNAWVASGDEPFGKEAMSLGDVGN